MFLSFFLRFFLQPNTSYPCYYDPERTEDVTRILKVSSLIYKQNRVHMYYNRDHTLIRHGTPHKRYKKSRTQHVTHKTHNYAWLHRTKTRAPGHFNSPYRLRSPLEQENCHPRSAEPYFYNWVSMYCSRHSLHVYSIGVTWTLCRLVSVSGQPRSGRWPDFLSSTVRTPVDCWLCFRVVRQTQTQVSE